MAAETFASTCRTGPLPASGTLKLRTGRGRQLRVPRSRFADLKEWPETRRPGIYFLFGVDEEDRARAGVRR
jgi:hypothetical protein